MTGMAALTPITGSPATRFVLDQAAASAFLARARRRWHGLPCPAAPPSEDWAADPRWNPRELPDDELPNLEALIVAAQEAGAITGPADWDIRLLITTDCDGVWYLWQAAGPPGMRFTPTSDIAENLLHIGEPETKGSRAALSILREAVEQANHILDALTAATGTDLAAAPAARHTGTTPTANPATSRAIS